MPKTIDLKTVYANINGERVPVPALKGKDGEAGKTPERGVDYWTESDKKGIIDETLNKAVFVEDDQGEDDFEVPTWSEHEALKEEFQAIKEGNINIKSLLGTQERIPDTSMKRFVEKFNLTDVSHRYSDWEHAFNTVDIHYYTDIPTAINDINGGVFTNAITADKNPAIKVYSYNETDVIVFELMTNTSINESGSVVTCEFPVLIDVSNHHMHTGNKEIQFSKSIAIYASTNDGYFDLVKRTVIGTVRPYIDMYCIGWKSELYGEQSGPIGTLMFNCSYSQYILFKHLDVRWINSNTLYHNMAIIFGFANTSKLGRKANYYIKFDDFNYLNDTAAYYTTYPCSLFYVQGISYGRQIEDTIIEINRSTIKCIARDIRNENDGDTVVIMRNGIFIVKDSKIIASRELSVSSRIAIIDNCKLYGESHGGVYVEDYDCNNKDGDPSLSKGTLCYINNTTLGVIKSVNPNYHSNTYSSYFGYGSTVYCNNVKFENEVANNYYPRISAYTSTGLLSNATTVYFSNCPNMNGMSSEANGTVYFGVGIPDAARDATINGTKYNTNEVYDVTAPTYSQFHIEPDGTVYAGKAIEIGETEINETKLQELINLPKIIKLTQEEYDLISVKDENTIYIII